MINNKIMMDMNNIKPKDRSERVKRLYNEIDRK